MRVISGAVWMLLVLASLIVGCDMPRDPEGTLRRATDGVLRVGVSANPPWTKVTDKAVTGIEAELVDAFAREIGARVEWTVGTETELLQALARFELDLVIAGLTRGTPWQRQVALTRAYVETASLIGLPPEVPWPGSLNGQEILARPGDPAIARARRRGARIVSARDLAAADRPVLAADWELQAWDFAPTGTILEQHAHVMAAPPGENALLLRLQRFLNERQNDVRAALPGMAR